MAIARIPALDGVRGLAILLVVLFHHTLMRQETLVDRVYVNLARLGWSGVDLFFVLSGFLITGILVDARGGRHYFRNFYVRRTLRIFPLYFAFLFYVLVVCPRVWPDTALARAAQDAMEGRSQAWYWFYASNLLFARDQTFGHPNLAVTWSLAIEEQFYLVWPLVVAVSGRRALLWTCCALVIGAFAIRAGLLAFGAHWIAPYVLPMCRMDALAAGALVALAVRGHLDPAWGRLSPLLRRAPLIAAGAATLLLVVWLAEDPLDNDDWSEPLMQTAGYSALAVLFAALVAVVVTGSADSLASRLFSVAPLRMLGHYSYALYLFHVPVRRFVRDEYFPVASFPTLFGSALPGQMLFYLAATAPALLLAWLSWHLYERHWLSLNRRFPYPRADVARPADVKPA